MSEPSPSTASPPEQNGPGPGPVAEAGKVTTNDDDAPPPASERTPPQEEGTSFESSAEAVTAESNESASPASSSSNPLMSYFDEPDDNDNEGTETTDDDPPSLLTGDISDDASSSSTTSDSEATPETTSDSPPTITSEDPAGGGSSAVVVPAVAVAAAVATSPETETIIHADINSAAAAAADSTTKEKNEDPSAKADAEVSAEGSGEGDGGGEALTRQQQSDETTERKNDEIANNKNDATTNATKSANATKGEIPEQPSPSPSPPKEEQDKKEQQQQNQPQEQPKETTKPPPPPNNNNNDEPTSTTPPPSSGDSPELIEAERQAAIAAAISANSSSYSPSVAAGIAKVLALPGLMSDKVGEIGERATSLGGGANIVGGVAGGAVGSGGSGSASRNSYPPPPPRQNQYQSGPTMVALPPVPPGGASPGPPHALKSRSHMRPVRFEDVKVAFAELLEKERRKERGDAAEDASEKIIPVEKELEETKNEKLEEEKEDSSIQKIEPDENNLGDGNKERVEGESNDADENDGSKSSKEGESAKDDKVAPSTEDKLTDETAAKKKGEGDAEGSAIQKNNPDTTDSEKEKEKEVPTVEVDSEKPSATDETTKDSPKRKSSKKDTASTEQYKSSIPDSYLRFLLLLARVPIILEEHRPPPSSSAKNNSHKKSKDKEKKEGKKHAASREVPKAAGAAAKRVLDIYRMAQRTYETISEGQQKHMQNTTGVRDATSSFFAACAGETVEQLNEDLEDIGSSEHSNGIIDNTTGKGGGAGSGRPPVNGVLTSRDAVSKQAASNVPPPPLSSSFMPNQQSQPSSSTAMTAASSMASSASAVFSNVMSKMVTKRQGSFSDLGKKFIGGSGGGQQSQQGGNPQRVAPVSEGHDSRQRSRRAEQPPPPQRPPILPRHSPPHHMMEDYEVMIAQEMLGLTVENVLERTIIRTLLPDGAAKHAGAQVGSLIAKVGNVDTSNLTHFETIDELRQSQRPLKLTLRHIGKDVLRRAREEMGRLIRGRGLATAASLAEVDNAKQTKPWRENGAPNQGTKRGETFDSVLSNRWPSSRSHKSSSIMGGSLSGAPGSSAPPVMTRGEMLHCAGKDLIRILSLLVVGLEKELSDRRTHDETKTDASSLAAPVGATNKPPLSVKELIEAIEITTKILLDYSRGHPDVDEKHPRPGAGGGGNKPSQFQPPTSSFYPVPPGRVQGKKHGGPPPGGPGRGGRGAGRGGRGGRGGKKALPNNSPLLRIGDALSRTRSFLVETSSVTATALRWEIIDYLCAVLDLDTEQELSEQESVSSSTGGEAGSSNDLGSAGSILKLIVLNCSMSEDSSANEDSNATSSNDNDSDSELSSLDQSSLSLDLDQSSRSDTANKSHAGNPFLSVVHRLAASKSTSARVSACSLGTVLWSHLDFPRQLQLRGVITRALHDVEVIVRKSTATVLHEIAELVFDRRAVPWLVLMCERSMTDPEPQLRAAAMTLTWHLAEHLPNAFLGDASKGSRSLRRLPPRTDPTFMDVYLLQCKLLPVANNLSEDRVASVRLSVAAQCDRLCNALGEHWFSVIIDLLQALLSDADERVRSEAILCMPRLVESVINGSSDNRNTTVLESLLPLALKIQKDSSSAVRSSLATATGELLIFLVGLGGSSGMTTPPPSPGRSNFSDDTINHKRHVDDTLIPILQKLLQDSDPEVTTASLRAVTNASRSSTRDTQSTRIPSCAHHQKLDTSIDDDLVSLSSQQTHDTHTSYERTKPVFIPVLREEQVLRLLPTLSNLATSTQWRVRQSAVEIVPALMGCTRRHETRHEISKLCLRLMSDKVDAVRKTAAECLCLGGSSLARHGEDDGGEWIKKIVIPHLKTCSQSEDSKQRLLSLKMIEIVVINGLCPTTRTNTPVAGVETPSPGSICDDESTSSSNVVETPSRMILNIAAAHTSDKVANVRLNVGRTFGAILHLLEPVDIDFAVATLQKQLDEETSRPGGGDRDVIYFAQQAMLSVPTRRPSSRMST